MKSYSFISIVCCFLLSACSMVTAASERTMDDAMLNFLPYLNQKVTGHLDSHDKISLDTKAYMNIVNEVCMPLIACGQSAERMFNTYDVQVRELDNMFSVMLCDKEGKVKKMEHFSCDEQNVEIQSYKESTSTKCAFETTWKGCAPQTK